MFEKVMSFRRRLKPSPREQEDAEQKSLKADFLNETVKLLKGEEHELYNSVLAMVDGGVSIFEIRHLLLDHVLKRIEAQKNIQKSLSSLSKEKRKKALGKVDTSSDSYKANKEKLAKAVDESLAIIEKRDIAIVLLRDEILKQLDAKSTKDELERVKEGYETEVYKSVVALIDSGFESLEIEEALFPLIMEGMGYDVDSGDYKDILSQIKKSLAIIKEQNKAIESFKASIKKQVADKSTAAELLKANAGEETDLHKSIVDLVKSGFVASQIGDSLLPVIMQKLGVDGYSREYDDVESQIKKSLAIIKEQNKAIESFKASIKKQVADKSTAAELLKANAGEETDLHKSIVGLVNKGFTVFDIKTDLLPELMVGIAFDACENIQKQLEKSGAIIADQDKSIAWLMSEILVQIKSQTFGTELEKAKKGTETNFHIAVEDLIEKGCDVSEIFPLIMQELGIAVGSAHYKSIQSQLEISVDAVKEKTSLKTEAPVEKITEGSRYDFLLEMIGELKNKFLIEEVSIDVRIALGSKEARVSPSSFEELERFEKKLKSLKGDEKFEALLREFKDKKTYMEQKALSEKVTKKILGKQGLESDLDSYICGEVLSCMARFTHAEIEKEIPAKVVEDGEQEEVRKLKANEGAAGAQKMSHVGELKKKSVPNREAFQKALVAAACGAENDRLGGTFVSRVTRPWAVVSTSKNFSENGKFSIDKLMESVKGNLDKELKYEESDLKKFLELGYNDLGVKGI